MYNVFAFASLYNLYIKYVDVYFPFITQLTTLSGDDKVKLEMVDIATVRAYHIIRKAADYLVMPIKKYGNFY